MTGCMVIDCQQKHDAKGYCASHYKRWKLHGDPLMVKQAPAGSGWIQKGHKFFTVDSKNVPEHRLIVERAIKRKLKGTELVHHMDGNGLNNANNNLCVCPDNAYHKLLHQRIDALKACGNPDWRKCPYCHLHDDPIKMRLEKSNRCVHAKCSALAKQLSRLKKVGKLCSSFALH